MRKRYLNILGFPAFLSDQVKVRTGQEDKEQQPLGGKAEGRDLSGIPKHLRVFLKDPNQGIHGVVKKKSQRGEQDHQK
jgi:hypothetical protein